MFFTLIKKPDRRVEWYGTEIIPANLTTSEVRLSDRKLSKGNRCY